MGSLAGVAIAAHLKACDSDMKVTVSFDLTFQSIKQFAMEIMYLSATKAGHVHTVAVRLSLTITSVAFHMRKAERIKQGMTL